MRETEKKSEIIDWIKQRTKESYKYWYIRCNDIEKYFYKEILRSLVNLSDHISIPLVNHKDFIDISQIYRYCIQDNPIIFYIKNCFFTTYNEHFRINYDYFYDLDEIYEILTKMNIALKKLEARCQNKTDIEKEKIVHDCIVRQVIYQKNESLPIHMCHSVFMHKAAVCDGISKAVKIMLNHVGINAFVVNGDALSQTGKGESGGHSWNMVYINNNLFHIDVTFDNTLTSDKKYICYDYFNLIDSQIFTDHFLKGYGTTSTQKAQDYYTMNKLVFSDSAEIIHHLRKCINCAKEHVAFRIEKIHLNKPFIEDIIHNATINNSIVKSYIYSINSSIKSVKILFIYR